jgi:hypothetical protein
VRRLRAALSGFGAFIALSACGSNSGVVKVNDDTYMVRAQDFVGTSGSAVKTKLYEQANEFCAAQGKKVGQTYDYAADYVAAKSFAGAELQFKCD